MLIYEFLPNKKSGAHLTAYCWKTPRICWICYLPASQEVQLFIGKSLPSIK